jgi:FkbM family methyltransferase
MNFFRRALFRLLGLDGYLTFIRKAFFVVFNAGYLKNDPVYSWHYFVPRLIHENDVIIDIGANMGYYAAIFARAVGNGGRVYCVEPVVPLYRQLSKQLSRRKNVCLLPYALGAANEDGIVVGVPENFRSLGYLRHGFLSLQEKSSEADGRYTFRAKLRKGSELFSSLQRIDYIKCDIEGHEAIVFEDMTDLLAKHRPIIQVEINGAEFDRVAGLFRELGYEGYKLINGTLVDISSLSREKKMHFDTLFVPPEYFSRIMPFVGQEIIGRKVAGNCV